MAVSAALLNVVELSNLVLRGGAAGAGGTETLEAAFPEGENKTFGPTGRPSMTLPMSLSNSAGVIARVGF
jgi:hypothetical protein